VALEHMKRLSPRGRENLWVGSPMNKNSRKRLGREMKKRK